jgi:hypothetical protein
MYELRGEDIEREIEPNRSIDEPERREPQPGIEDPLPGDAPDDPIPPKEDPHPDQPPVRTGDSQLVLFQ